MNRQRVRDIHAAHMARVRAFENQRRREEQAVLARQASTVAARRRRGPASTLQRGDLGLFAGLNRQQRGAALQRLAAGARQQNRRRQNRVSRPRWLQ